MSKPPKSKKVAYPVEPPCPFGAHSFRWWWNGLGIACWRCHTTWELSRAGARFIATTPARETTT